MINLNLHGNPIKIYNLFLNLSKCLKIVMVVVNLLRRVRLGY